MSPAAEHPDPSLMAAPAQDPVARPRTRLPNFKKYPRPPAAPPPERSTTSPDVPLANIPQSSASANRDLPPPSGGPALPLMLRRNRFQPAPRVTKPHEAKVASQNVLHDFVVTSPNTDYVPEYPVEREVIRTYRDGRWGLHEYSRWPQAHVDGMLHVACIPRRPAPPDLPTILWDTLVPETHWAEDSEIAVSGFGYIKRDTREQLQRAAEIAIKRYESIREVPATVQRYGQFLVMVLRQVVDRMTHLPTVGSRAVAVAAHVQRICLELAGLKTYLETVLTRLQSRLNFSDSVLDVVGAFLRDGADMDTWWRVGLPFWVVQPLRPNLAVWRVVDYDRPSATLSNVPVDPPIMHAAGAFIGVTNFTGNWLSSMVMSVSKHVSGSHLSQLSLVAVPALPSDHPEDIKRRRIDEGEVCSKHLAMRASELPKDVEQSQKKKRRRHKRGPGANAPGVSREGHAEDEEGSLHTAPTADAESSRLDQPARTLTLPAFYHIPEVWERALRVVSPVVQTQASALYFFPPPFLLDTLPLIPLSMEGCLHPERARKDHKIGRYLHNLARIRHFCRARMFDASLDSRPLTIAEWRVALWGKYLPEPPLPPPRIDMRPTDARRAKRRQDERNSVAYLFRHVAHMDLYSPGLSVALGDLQVDADSVETQPRIRKFLLWESHEINFRAELLALDALMVQTPHWLEIHKWEREALVSEVWGEPSSCVTAITGDDEWRRAYGWHSPVSAGQSGCRTTLRKFAHVLSRWPGCPNEVLEGGKCELDTAEEYEVLQRRAIHFYVETFVQHYSRLPTPPIPFPREDNQTCIIA